MPGHGSNGFSVSLYFVDQNSEDTMLPKCIVRHCFQKKENAWRIIRYFTNAHPASYNEAPKPYCKALCCLTSQPVIATVSTLEPGQTKPVPVFAPPGFANHALWCQPNCSSLAIFAGPDPSNRSLLPNSVALGNQNCCVFSNVRAGIPSKIAC